MKTLCRLQYIATIHY